MLLTVHLRATAGVEFIDENGGGPGVRAASLFFCCIFSRHKSLTKPKGLQIRLR
jgi:hypothetical protein